jgi:hypothetical protein
MTKVDVCTECDTMFLEGEDHCRRCGADRRTSSVRREMKDLCPTYTGEEAAMEDAHREVMPIFEPSWGKVQWYETEDGRQRARRAGADEDGTEDEGPGDGTNGDDPDPS